MKKLPPKAPAMNTYVVLLRGINVGLTVTTRKCTLRENAVFACG
jgi:hypothetical protein